MKYTKMTKMMESSVLPLAAAAFLVSGVSMAADEAPKAGVETPASDTSVKMVVEKKVSEEEKNISADDYYKMGRNDYTKGNFLDAIDSLLKAKEVLLRDKDEVALSDMEKEKLEKIRNLLNDAYFGRAQELFRDAEKKATAGNYDEAVKLCQDAKENYPGCAEIMDDMIKKYEKLKSAVEYNDSVKGENIDPDYQSRDLDIQKEMRKGQNFYKIGQWAKARDHFNVVLQLDPYNEMAIDYLRRCYEKLIQTGSARRDVIAQERLAEVTWSSISPIMSLPADAKMSDATPKSDEKDGTSDIRKKLEEIKVGQLDFEEQPLADAVDFLRRLSKEQDPEKKGVNILLILNEDAADSAGAEGEAAGAEGEAAGAEGEAAGAETTAGTSDETADADDAAAPAAAGKGKYMIDYMRTVSSRSLKDAIDLVCDACKGADLQIYVEPDAVLICDGSVVRDEYELAVFEAEKDWFDEYSSDTAGGSSNDPDLHYKTYFGNRGIKFPAKSGVKFDESINRLIVKNTKEANLQIQSILEERRNRETKQVLVQVKFVEISLSDLEELGFEYTFSRENDTRSTAQSIQDYLQTEMGKQDGVRYSTDENGNLIATLDDPKTLVYYKMGRTGDVSYEGISYNPTGVTSAATVSLGEGSTVNLGQNPSGYYLIPQNVLSSTEDGDFVINNTKIYGSAVTFKQNDRTVRNASIDAERDSFMSADMDNRILPDNDTAVDWSYSDNNGYNAGAKLHALDQADSTDVLSAPRVMTVTGQEAIIRMVTKRYFPEDWSEADMSTNDNITVFQPSQPTFKQDPFQDGIILSASPEVEQGVITMRVAPIIQDFIGWSDYSYNVPYKDPRTKEEMDVENKLKMPIFEVRQVETAANISNGETVVLGGVIKDSLTNVDDQYPILGDLPLVGRFFQSKGRSSSKVNLLIFMTCTLVKPDGSPIRKDSEIRGVPAFRY